MVSQQYSLLLQQIKTKLLEAFPRTLLFAKEVCQDIGGVFASAVNKDHKNG